MIDRFSGTIPLSREPSPIIKKVRCEHDQYQRKIIMDLSKRPDGPPLVSRVGKKFSEIGYRFLDSYKELYNR
jgi:hypothetical protein